VQANIFITDKKQVQIADLGLAMVVEEAGIDMTATSSNAGTSFWMSPQRLSKPGHKRNMADDVWAYSLLSYLVNAKCLTFCATAC
jgi:serine/threonine protein kinase